MKKYKKVNCSPNPKNKLDFTCYTSNALVKLKQIWNARHPDSMITSNDPRTIWQRLKVKMGNQLKAGRTHTLSSHFENLNLGGHFIFDLI